MDALTPITALPRLIDRASKALLSARSSAEVLEAGMLADVAYSASKLAARMAKAKGAHDTVVAAAHRAQADALEIKAGAELRLADEYDAAQERGEVADVSDGRRSSKGKDLKPTVKDIGISHKQIHEARAVRDAEKRNPGVVRRALNRQLANGEEPTKAALRNAVAGPRKARVNDAVAFTFLGSADECRRCAYYKGSVTQEIIESAQRTADAWNRLVNQLKGSV